MPTGRLKFFDSSKGFGFIIPDERGADVFFGRSEISMADLAKLKALDRLQFEMGRHPITDRPVGVKLRLIEQDFAVG